MSNMGLNNNSRSLIRRSVRSHDNNCLKWELSSSASHFKPPSWKSCHYGLKNMIFHFSCRCHRDILVTALFLVPIQLFLRNWSDSCFIDKIFWNAVIAFMHYFTMKMWQDPYLIRGLAAPFRMWPIILISPDFVSMPVWNVAKPL